MKSKIKNDLEERIIELSKDLVEAVNKGYHSTTLDLMNGTLLKNLSIYKNLFGEKNQQQFILANNIVTLKK